MTRPRRLASSTLIVAAALLAGAATGGLRLQASAQATPVQAVPAQAVPAQATPAQATPAQATPAATQAPKGSAAEGQKLFVSYGCYQCHGLEAQGSSATGPRLGPRPLPYAAFARYVRRPAAQMPPYTDKVVSDAALANIYAFVESRPAPPASVPLLR